MVDLQERRGRELFGFARHLGLTDEEAHDASQEALLRLWSAIGRREGHRAARCAGPSGRSTGSAWTNTGGGGESGDWPSACDGGATTAEGDQSELIAVWDAVERLPERQRLAIYLRYRADLPFEEIGAILGIAAASARSHVSRALDTLRGRLSDEMETNR